MKKLLKKEKILYTLFLMSEGKKIDLRYEDVLVRAYEYFPEDFHFKNYPQYPDTDTLRRELYWLIPAGFVRISNRKCMLTDSGLEKGNDLMFLIKGKKLEITSQQEIQVEKEVTRILKLQGFQMFLQKKYNQIIDRDYYEFFNVSVRTRSVEIEGSFQHVKFLVEKIAMTNKSLAKKLKGYSQFLIDKFSNLFKD